MRRLFVSDLDGTLLNSQAELSDVTTDIINRGICEGLEFTVSTARTPTTALKIIKGLNLKLPVMMMNGVLVYDMEKERYIKKEILDETTVMILLGMIKLRGLACFLYGLEGDKFSAYYDSVESTALNYFRNERIMKYDKKFTETADLSLVANKDIIYIVLRETKDKLEGLYRDLQVVKGVKAEFYADIYSDEYYMLEIYSENASKKAALSYLREYGHYESIIGFGDNLNDVSLMEGCDYFCAVENAKPEIKEMADVVIGASCEDGVARFMEQFLEQTGERE